MPDPEIWALTSKKGWPKIACEKTIWIPCPETTEQLGTGLQSQYLQRFAHGTELTGVVNYTWRVEELDTDLRVFTACGDLGRLQAAIPDIDELVRNISVEPL